MSDLATLVSIGPVGPRFETLEAEVISGTKRVSIGPVGPRFETGLPGGEPLVCECFNRPRRAAL